MRRYYLLILLLLAAFRAKPPNLSSSDKVASHFQVSLRTAQSTVLVIDYREAKNQIKATGVVRKSHKYGIDTKKIAAKDTLNLLIDSQIFQSSIKKEEELLDNIHTGKPIKFLLKEIKDDAENGNISKYPSWHVLEIY